MTRRELARLVAERTGTGPAEAGRTVSAVLDAIRDALARGETVRMPGLGTFQARERPARTARNPRTGAEIGVPAARTVRFRPATLLRGAVNAQRG